MEPTQPIAKPIAKKKYRVLVLLFLAGMLSLHLIIAWDSIDLIRKGYPDFSTFYSGASIVRQGLGKQLYDEATQYRVQLQFAAGVSIRQGPLPYIHPPFEALLFIPFTWLSYPTAYLLWNLLNLVFLVRSVFPAAGHRSLAETGIDGLLAAGMSGVLSRIFRAAARSGHSHARRPVRRSLRSSSPEQ